MTNDWQPLALPGCEDARVDIVPAVMDYIEARDCVTRLKDHWQAFWFELKALHDRRGWEVLGYHNFKWCVHELLGISEVHAYRLIEAAGIYAELQTNPGVSLDGLTERHARELKPLPPTARVAIARRTDFRETSAPQLRETVERAKDALDRLDDEDPDWDAVVAQVAATPSVIDARLLADYSRAVCRVTEGLLELPPAEVVALQNEADRLAGMDFVGELRAWCAAYEDALQQPLRLLPGKE